MDKKVQLQNLIQEMSQDSACESMFEVNNDKNLINQFKYSTFIPNKWFDWPKYSESKIMIIGQDWGPYAILQRKFIDRFEIESKGKDFDYDKFLYQTFSSRTEKFIQKSIEYWFEIVHHTQMNFRDWDNYFFTIAVMFCRSGNLFRGSTNFDAKRSLAVSRYYLKKQIEIVQPQKIMTLGDLALRQVFSILGIGDKRKLSEIVLHNDKFNGQEIEIFPNFHPASHVDKKIIREKFQNIVSY